MKNLSRKKFFVPVLLFLSISAIMLIAGAVMKIHYDNMERKVVGQQSSPDSAETSFAVMMPNTVLAAQKPKSTEAVKAEKEDVSVSDEGSASESSSKSDDERADDSKDDDEADSEPKMTHVKTKDTSETSPAAFGDAIAFTAYDYKGTWFPAEIVFDDIVWEDDDKDFIKQTMSLMDGSGTWFPTKHSTSESKFAVLKFSVILPEDDVDGFVFKGNMKPNIEVKKNGSGLVPFRTVYDDSTNYKPGDVIDMIGMFEYDGSKDLYFTFDFNGPDGHEVGYVKQ